MANSEAGTSSDAALASGGEYQVFLSFRGPDTRHGFTDFLYHGLVDVGVCVFRDNEELRVGEVIGENLQSAINNSIIYIPIFSRTYASSRWCLWELAQIVDNVSKSKDKKKIFPIFLDVEPEDVKLRTPAYRDALVKHESMFPNEVEAWRAALVEVGKIKGWNVTSSQAKIVESVVAAVLERLKTKQKLVTEHPVGLDDMVKCLIEKLDVDDFDVRLFGIYGMGGIGKTTIAKIIFNLLCPHFKKYCSFLDDVREISSTNAGLVQLQERLLYDISSPRLVGTIRDSEEGRRRIGSTLCNRKVLVVLDDVDKKETIENLIGNFKLYPGTRIIVTTRNKDILQLQVEESNIKLEEYEMQTMADDHALRLFCRHAFGKDYPLDDYSELSRKIVSHMGGLPLAIQVVGSLLQNKEDKEFWEEKLLMLRELSMEKVLETLRISYNDLGANPKKIFLDIACFLFNKKESDAIHMWKSCKFDPKEGIDVLTKRCLIKILGNGKIWMHDQLRALGRQIVREDSADDIEKQSRLWITEEALQIIKTNEKKDKIEAIQVHQVGWPRPDCIKVTNKEFERLPNLRFLELCNGTFDGDFARCPSKLRWLHWEYGRPHFLDWWPDRPYPREEDHFTAENLYMHGLVVCELHDFHFKDDSKAWNLIKRAWDMKVLSIIRSEHITTIPDIYECMGLERLTLEYCLNLKRIESFIGNLRSLIELKIEHCFSLKYLPEEIGALVKLKHFSLSGCENLIALPSSIGDLTSLTELDLSDTSIIKLFNSIGKLKSLQILRFPFNFRQFVCYHDRQLPSGISTLVKLKELDLSGHNVTGEIAGGIGELFNLRILNLQCTRICEIPRTINMIGDLQTLNLRHCHEIQGLPELPASLTCLLLESRSLRLVPNLSNLSNLVELQLSDGSSGPKGENPLEGCSLMWIGRLSNLKSLYLNLPNVVAPLELASLFHLEKLVLRHLDIKSLMQLPSSDSSWRNLSTFRIHECEVEDISLEALPRLEKFTVEDCVRLQRLSISSELRRLRRVNVILCQKLVEIRVVGLSKSLQHLGVYHCDELAAVEGLNELEFLSSLDVWWCPSLRCLINVSCTKIGDDCIVSIIRCGESTRDTFNLKDSKDTFSMSDDGMSLKRYREENCQNTSSQVERRLEKLPMFEEWLKAMRNRGYDPYGYGMVSEDRLEDEEDGIGIFRLRGKAQDVAFSRMIESQARSSPINEGRQKRMRASNSDS